MYIEVLRIKGFKSFRGETTVSFNRHFNIIVGKSGSGKSSLFHALALVLGAALPTDANERKDLINVNCNKASITILVNNESGRFPEADFRNFGITRSFTSDEDTITFNHVRITLLKLKSMLQISGFPVYPHYLTDSIEEPFELRDEMRFQELKKAMCFVHKESVNKNIQKLSERIKQQKNTVEDYFGKWIGKFNNGSDPSYVNMKKCRYFYLKKKLPILEEKKRSLREVSKKVATISISIKDKEENLNLTKDISKKIVKNDEETENLIISDSIDNVKFSIDDLISQINSAVARKAAISKRQNDDISDLNNIEVEYSNDLNNLNNLRMKLYENICLIARRELPTEESQRELQTISNRIAAQKAKNNEIEEITKGFEADIKTLNKSSQKNKLLMNQFENELVIKQFDYEQLVDKMKRVQRDSEELNSSKLAVKNRLISIERSLFSFHYQKHLHVQEILKDLKLARVEGRPIDENCLVIDKVKCLEECEFAVEAVGGNKLFNYILSTNTQLEHLSEKYKERYGTFQGGFYVLNNIEEQQSNFQLNNTDGRPLLECISYDEIYAKLFQLIFGRVVLCRNDLPGSAQDLDYVMYNGDVMFSTGLVKSGYKNEKNNKIRLQKKRASLKAQIKKLDELLNINANNRHESENSLTILKQEINDLEIAKAKLKEEARVSVEEINLLNLDWLRKALKNEKNLLNELELISKTLRAEPDRRVELNFDEIAINSEIDKLKALKRRAFFKWQTTSQRLLAEQDRLRQSSEDNIAININIDENIRNHRANLHAYQHQLTILEKAKDLQAKLFSNERIKQLLKDEPNLELSIIKLKEELRICEKRYQEANIDTITNEIIDITAEMGNIENQKLFDIESQPWNDMSVEELGRNYAALKKTFEKMKFTDAKSQDLGYGTIQSTANYVTKIYNGFEIAKELSCYTAQNQLNKMKGAFALLKRMFERIVNDMLLNYQAKLVFSIVHQNDGRVTFKFANKGNLDYDLSLNSLSLGEKETVFLALNYALQNFSKCPIYMLDEPDKHMDKFAVERFTHLLRNNLLESSTNQIIISTLHEEMFVLHENYIKIFMDEMQSNVSIIEIAEAIDISVEVGEHITHRQVSRSIVDVSL